MGDNKKLIKRIKKEALKSFENDMKESVLKELYEKTSKKEIKKIKKQILRELQEEIFGSSKKKSKKKKKDNADLLFETLEEAKEVAEKVEEEGEKQEDGKYTYKGFKFDVEKMKALATGRKPIKGGSDLGIERIKNGKSKEELLEAVKGFDALSGNFPFGKPTEKTSEETLKKLESLMNMKEGKNKDLVEKSLNLEIGNMPISIPTPSGRYTSKTKIPTKDVSQRITPAKKEELEFFMGKLKKGVSELEESRKHINYRHRKDDIYNFTYTKEKEPFNIKDVVDEDKEKKEDFTLHFDIDLNVKNCSAQINKFEFKIDGFKFDASFFKLLDVVKVLDLVGMNLSQYIMTINGINGPKYQEEDKSKKAPKKKTIRGNTKLDKFIDDKRIIKTLNKNDIANYSQLKRFLENNDLTSLKGIGEKTADKIQGYIKA